MAGSNIFTALLIHTSTACILVLLDILWTQDNPQLESIQCNSNVECWDTREIVNDQTDHCSLKALRTYERCKPQQQAAVSSLISIPDYSAAAQNTHTGMRFQNTLSTKKTLDIIYSSPILNNRHHNANLL